MESTGYQETEKVELEDQFILRLPQEEANYVRYLMAMKPKKLRKKLKLDVDPERGEGVVTISGKSLQCRLRKLPTVVESLKTYNKNVFVKTADICQILDCVDFRSGLEYPHGLSPPLKNVKNKRFRKCLINRDEASVNVQKELFYLLQADLEALKNSNNSLFSVELTQSMTLCLGLPLPKILHLDFLVSKNIAWATSYQTETTKITAHMT